VTKPLFQNTFASEIAKLRQRVTRLERRPNPSINPATAPGGGYDTAFNLLTPHGLNNMSIYNGFAFTDNFGVNRYNQFYIEATTDAKNWGRIVRLGPEGSLWGFTLVMRKSSDAAKVKVQIASISEDGVSGTHPGTGTLVDGEDVGLTYYDLYRIPSSSTLEADLYAAGTTEYEFYGLQWQFQLNGTGALTTTPTLDVSDSLNLLDSGSGMYGIKFLTSGKNASSSSYRARYHYAVLSRMTENLLET
jgi:hypothetical protein